MEVIILYVRLVELLIKKLTLNFFDMELVYMLSAVLSVAMVVCFFMMGSNIGKLRRIFDRQNPNTALNDYYKHLFWGEQEAASTCLKNAFWYDFKQMNREPVPKEARLENYEKLKAKYNKAFTKQAIQVPEWNGESYLNQG